MIADEQREAWQAIPGHPARYEVSNIGRVRSGGADGRLLKPKLDRDGYLTYYLNCGTRTERIYVKAHRLVALAFIGPAPFPKAMVRHLNGDNQDNRVANLAWGSMSDNAKDAVRHGTHNNARRTHCVHGHPFSGDNLVVSDARPGRRFCRTCLTARQSRQTEQRRANRGAA